MDRASFDRILEQGWPAILAWKDQEKEESLYFECKAKENSQNYMLSAKDKGDISESVCGFANTSGGVLAFGIHATGGNQGMPDRVQNIRAIADVDKTKELIDKILYELTNPPIVGLEARVIRNNNGDGTGVILVWVPENEAGPCQTAIGPEASHSKYYGRFGSRTRPIPHSILSAMMLRQHYPKLSLSVIYSIFRSGATLRVAIQNTGRGIADRLAIQFYNLPIDGIRLFQWHNFSCNNGWHLSIVEATADQPSGSIVNSPPGFVLYPGMKLVFGEVGTYLAKPIEQYPISLHGYVYSLNMIPHRFDIDTIINMPISMNGRQTEEIKIQLHPEPDLGLRIERR